MRSHRCARSCGTAKLPEGVKSSPGGPRGLRRKETDGCLGLATQQTGGSNVGSLELLTRDWLVRDHRINLSVSPRATPARQGNSGLMRPLVLTSVPVDGYQWTTGCFQVQGPVDLNLEDMLSQEGHASATEASCSPTVWVKFTPGTNLI